MDGGPMDVVEERDEFTRGRRRAATACLVGVGVPVLLVVAVVVIGVVTIDWGPGARGLADPEDVRPFPAGVEVIGEVAGCGGTGDGWHVCERRVRVRMRETSRAELAGLLADHYRAAGHEMDALNAGGAGDGRLFGPTSCDGPDGELLCLYLEVPVDRSGLPTGGEQPADAPEDAAVDIVAITWAYYL